ncbi:MAG: type II toxin-antitoxin system PemK/MazF family toxin [Rhodoplanes sp.]|uniref:type II toxin-antitoxin system PemK/MazF family toxin n=1 Tax=Rhodoplanes sp. TaxID=1968906 RepID=UPI00179F20D8|nr:type II toxin-antitoxin system PemK/MazF family toxin [Rhodoplanes sp.]NVO12998.1 type II toxin-antitoxin system PemK/MazF family toxin [Rhodoplanes sp.]
MKRGEIWTVAAGAGYAGKPRPAIIVQSDLFDLTASVTICPLTRTDAPLSFVRFLIAPTQKNGLLVDSFAMVDKIVTVQTTKLGYRIGRLDDRDVPRLNQAVATFLGLAD